MYHVYSRGNTTCNLVALILSHVGPTGASGGRITKQMIFNNRFSKTKMPAVSAVIPVWLVPFDAYLFDASNPVSISL